MQGENDGQLSSQTKFFNSWLGPIVDNQIYENDIIAWTPRNGGYNPQTQSWSFPVGGPGGIKSTSAEWEFSDNVLIGNFFYSDPVTNYQGYTRFALYGEFAYSDTGELVSALVDKYAMVSQARDFSNNPELDYELVDVGNHVLSGADLNRLFHFSVTDPFLFEHTVRIEISESEFSTYELGSDRIIENPVRSLSPLVGSTLNQFMDGVPNGRQYFEAIAGYGSSFVGDVV